MSQENARKIVRSMDYVSHEEALEDVGLSEQYAR
jgi:hypothetical protein